MYAGSSSIGCSDRGCYCCIEDTTIYPSPPPVSPVPPSPPSPVPPSSGQCDAGATCGKKMPKGTDPLIGKCLSSSKDPDEACADEGLVYVSDTVGCAETSSCFCCVSRPLPPPSPPPPAFPPPAPAPEVCPETCEVVLSGNGGNDVTFVGKCVPHNPDADIYEDIETCYDADIGGHHGDPVPGNFCGPDSCQTTCCIDSSALCGGDGANCPAGQSGECDCLLTHRSANNPCTGNPESNPPYPGLIHQPDPPDSGPTGGGSGCKESNCNAYAQKFLKDYPDVGASCCAFCPTTRRRRRVMSYQ